MPTPLARPKTSLVKTAGEPHFFRRAGTVALGVAASWTLAANLSAQTGAPSGSVLDFERRAKMMRADALMRVEPQVTVPTTAPVRAPVSLFASRYPWKENIVTTVFWVGEQPTRNNPTPNRASSWDDHWAANYGGFDDPDVNHRRNFIPIAFVPRQNPFYFALPYNDVGHGGTKPEARVLIPWFRQAFVQEGHTVCKDRWIAIAHGSRVAYAQWEDCGPWSTDHYQYVFGNERPRSSLNGGAGLDVSPAVRDYIGMDSGTDVTSWKFVEASEVPSGPWQLYGDNNPFVTNRASTQRHVQTTAGPSLFGH